MACTSSATATKPLPMPVGRAPTPMSSNAARAPVIGAARSARIRSVFLILLGHDHRARVMLALPVQIVDVDAAVDGLPGDLAVPPHALAVEGIARRARTGLEVGGLGAADVEHLAGHAAHLGVEEHDVVQAVA